MHPQTWIFMGCLTVRWRKRSPAADQAHFMGTYAQKDASSEKVHWTLYSFLSCDVCFRNSVNTVYTAVFPKRSTTVAGGWFTSVLIVSISTRDSGCRTKIVSFWFAMHNIFHFLQDFQP